ncbi:hypothetical protein GCM10023310_08210 [Paenibacillus vulneris]|uniref:Uncharacterized protein n=1 Tax=Paenibacillus vulneris TaxID=1133364 RepID=A0ABW3UNS8_9BACL
MYAINEAATYVEQSRSLHDSVKNAYAQLSEHLSQLDRTINEVMHEIEKREIHDVESGYAAAKMLRDLLRQRRVAKDQLLLMRPVFLMLERADITEMDKQFRRVLANSIRIRESLNY